MSARVPPGRERRGGGRRWLAAAAGGARRGAGRRRRSSACASRPPQLEQDGDLAGALQKYELLSEQFPEAPAAAEALLRLIAGYRRAGAQ